MWNLIRRSGCFARSLGFHDCFVRGAVVNMIEKDRDTKGEPHKIKNSGGNYD